MGKHCPPALLRVVVALLLSMGSSVVPQLSLAAHDAFIDELVSFTPGPGAGFGQELLPDVILGPPLGAGLLKGSFDVVSLGHGGVIVVRFSGGGICDGAGIDFTIFENAFHIGSEDGAIFTDFGIVSVSQDGVDYFEFAYDTETLAGLAGTHAVLSNPDNEIDPTDPTVSGGDLFDLADVGLDWAAYVRITDTGLDVPDIGNMVPPGDNGGFDLDAMAVINPCGSMPTTTSTTSTMLIPTTTTSTTTTSSTSTTFPQPRCGNGTVEGDEQCEPDGVGSDWQPGDWCTSQCTAVECGDPDDSGTHTASDALFVLRAAVGIVACDERVCNVDGSAAPATITAGDALRLLRLSIGIGGTALNCPLNLDAQTIVNHPIQENRHANG